MEELKLTFPVVYYGIFKKSAIRTEYNKLNYLFSGTIVKKQGSTPININTMTGYKRGRYPVGMDVLSEVQKMKEDELQERIREMAINEPLGTINAFHQFALSNLTITSGNRLELNRSFLDAVTNNRPEIYIARAYKISLYETDARKMSGNEIKILEGLREEQPLTEFVEVVKAEVPDLPSSTDIAKDASFIYETVKNVIMGLLPAELFTPTINTNDEEELDRLYTKLIQDGARDMIKSGYLTLNDYKKLKTLRELADMADRFYKENIPFPPDNNKGQEEDEPGKTADGWANFFYESIGDYTDEAMKVLFSKVLAGETERPGSFSVRTVKTLGSMTKDEAMLFQHACKYLMTDAYGTKFIFSDANLMLCGTNQNMGLTPENMQVLVSLGLFGGAETKTEYDQGFNNRGFMDGNDNFLLVTNKENDFAPMSYDRYVLLPCGQELLSILDVTPDPEYIGHIRNVLEFDLMERLDKNYEVHIYKVLEKTDYVIYLDTSKEIHPFSYEKSEE